MLYKSNSDCIFPNKLIKICEEEIDFNEWLENVLPVSNFPDAALMTHRLDSMMNTRINAKLIARRF
jgi:hypothetical protein